MPPHFIDGVVSLPGFILNGGTHYDNKNIFFVAPSWESMRFAKPLSPGGRYQAYVAIVPRVDGHSFDGDVYILQDSEIVGLVEAIKSLRWPRTVHMYLIVSSVLQSHWRSHWYFPRLIVGDSHVL